MGEWRQSEGRSSADISHHGHRRRDWQSPSQRSRRLAPSGRGLVPRSWKRPAAWPPTHCTFIHAALPSVYSLGFARCRFSDQTQVSPGASDCALKSAPFPERVLSEQILNAGQCWILALGAAREVKHFFVQELPPQVSCLCATAGSLNRSHGRDPGPWPPDSRPRGLDDAPRWEAMEPVPYSSSKPVRRVASPFPTPRASSVLSAAAPSQRGTASAAPFRCQGQGGGLRVTARERGLVSTEQDDSEKRSRS